VTFDEFQTECERTARAGVPAERLANFALGLAGETGEVCEPLKKHLFHGRDLDRDALAKELGDVLFYVSALASTLGLSLDDVAAANIAKLRARYPDGFSVEAARAIAGEPSP
jgi:NTP pyrophosphatase (non-canonical NTP hydrolase)